MAAVLEQVEHRRFGCQSGSKGKASNPAFGVSQRGLEGHPRRVLRACVLETLVHSGRGLDECRRGVDRRNDGAGRWVDLLPTMDGACVGAMLAIGLGHAQSTLRRRWLTRSMRVIRPRKRPPSSTTTTWPRSNTANRSLKDAVTGTVSTPVLMALWTGSPKRDAASKTANSKSDSSITPTTRSAISTGSCETS